MKTNFTRKITSGLVIGCLFLSLGTLAAAYDGQEASRPKTGITLEKDRPSPADREQHLDNSLDKLVHEGTISKIQADRILSFFKEKDSQHKAEMEKMKAMSPEDREAYKQQKCNDHPSFINELKSAADLSDAQAQTVAEALRPPHEPQNMEQRISVSLDKLINEGTISKIQADKILSFFKEKNSQRKAEMGKMKAMSPEDREAYKQQKCNTHPNFINELKSTADLSDEQAALVAEALRPPHKAAPEGSIHPMMPKP